MRGSLPGLSLWLLIFKSIQTINVYFESYPLKKEIRYDKDERMTLFRFHML